MNASSCFNFTRLEDRKRACRWHLIVSFSLQGGEGEKKKSRKGVHPHDFGSKKGSAPSGLGAWRRTRSKHLQSTFRRLSMPGHFLSFFTCGTSLGYGAEKESMLEHPFSSTNYEGTPDSATYHLMPHFVFVWTLLHSRQEVTLLWAQQRYAEQTVTTVTLFCGISPERPIPNDQ